MPPFKLEAPFKPCGHQPEAIAKLVAGVEAGKRHQALLGVTGSGKTFTMANLVERVQKPTLVLVHNKTLAGQLYQEFKQFFPKNAVEYFVSYYDYYQPEAYLPSTDTYIEKEADINDEIDRLRHSATAALLSREDVIVVASVSAIYGLGSPAEYRKTMLPLHVGQRRTREELINLLVDMQYLRSTGYERGSIFVRGGMIDILQPGLDHIVRVELDGPAIGRLQLLHPVSRAIEEQLQHIAIFPAKHFVIAPDILDRALASIEQELTDQVAQLTALGKIMEADRLKRRTRHDIALLREVGYCNGIENYSRHLAGRQPGEAPSTLLDYFPKDFLMVLDESNAAITTATAITVVFRSRSRCTDCPKARRSGG